jgi:hypothetical protein
VRVPDAGSTPGAKRRAEHVFGDVRGRIVYLEDVLSPTTEEWAET